MPKHGNGEGSIYPVKDKNGRVKGYRGSYWVHTAEGPKRMYISGKKREDVRDKLAKALRPGRWTRVRRRRPYGRGV